MKFLDFTVLIYTVVCIQVSRRGSKIMRFLPKHQTGGIQSTATNQHLIFAEFRPWEDAQVLTTSFREFLANFLNSNLFVYLFNLVFYRFVLILINFLGSNVEMFESPCVLIVEIFRANLVNGLKSEKCHFLHRKFLRGFLFPYEGSVNTDVKW